LSYPATNIDFTFERAKIAEEILKSG